mmetsp:Transcript_28512/g.40849  ORF Transcript_28512/g.40849 Transcript_28512/m.40849 type:complete len:279 (-) Transcript_28512:178-1014(-)
MVMITPRKKARYGVDESDMNSFSPFAFDPDSEYNPSVFASYLQEISEVLAKFLEDYTSLKNHVALDVDIVMSSVNRLTNHIGKDAGLLSGAPLPSVWSGIDFVHNKVENVEHLLSSVQRLTTTFRTELNSVESNLRFTPVIKEIQGVGSALNSELDSLFAQLTPVFQLYQSLSGPSGLPGGMLEDRLATLERREHGGVIGASTLGSSSLEQVIARITVLENRYNSKTVGVGGFSFQSLEEVQAFVLAEIPSNRYGYFYEDTRETRSGWRRKGWKRRGF